jgi:hypothetical protein
VHVRWGREGRASSAQGGLEEARMVDQLSRWDREGEEATEVIRKRQGW